MKLYLAGPMTGLPENNFPAFHAAAARLRSVGYEVVSPAEMKDEKPDERSWSYWMRRDLKLLADVDGIATLPGCENSKGASLEIYIAHELGMPVRDVDFLIDILTGKLEMEVINAEEL